MIALHERVSSASRNLLAGVDRPSDDLFRRLFLVSFLLYLGANRLIPDIYVLPVGLSIRPWEVLLGLLAVTWFSLLIVQPKPLPAGAVGLVSLLLLVVLVVSYFWNAPGFSEFQAGAWRRGLLRVFSYAVLFLASYHLAYDFDRTKRILSFVVGLTAIQGGIGIYEYLSGRGANFLHSLWTGAGLTLDPTGIRSFAEYLRTRLTGQAKVASTAPHPLVLSAVLALGILLTVLLLIHSPNRQSRNRYGVLLLPQLVALPLTNSRSGFVILVVVGVVLVLLQVRKWPANLPLALALMMLMGTVLAFVPNTARLLLNSFTRPQDDPNLEVRLARFDRVPELMSERPFLGAGYLTNDVDLIVFDNAYNLALLELGILGFILMVLFFLVCLGRSLSGLARSHPLSREPMLPLCGVIGALALLTGAMTFDAWTFDQFLPTCLILLGVGVGRADIVWRRQSIPSTGRSPIRSSAF